MSGTLKVSRDFRCRARIKQVVQDVLVQWLWFAAGISPDRVGYGPGPLTWVRALRHRFLHRDIHICLLSCSTDWLESGPLTAWSINRNSRFCTASVNEGLDRADIIWVCAQDPLPPECRHELEHKLRTEARRGAMVINRPSSYNAYHQGQTFQYLADNGVSVPRSALTEADAGVTRVVYKELGRQAAPKRNVVYSGPKPGMTAFEFINSATEDGLYRRYRAHFCAGLVRASELFLTDHWNVCMRNAIEVQYGFQLSRYEIEQIRRIADLLELDYFAVDFVRRASDDRPFFTDINVYPTICSPQQFVRARGDFGKWHTFDACARLGIEEPLGGNFWDHFDHSMARFARDDDRALASPRGAAAWVPAASITKIPQEAVPAMAFQSVRGADRRTGDRRIEARV